MSGREGGFSLVEVVVALVLLQVGLLGVIGLFTVASARLTRAQLVERAVAELAAVADSLSVAGASLAGQSVRGDWRVTWEGDGAGLVIRAFLRARPDGEPLVEVGLP